MKYFKGSAFFHFSWPGKQGLSAVLFDLIKMRDTLHISSCPGSPGGCVRTRYTAEELPSSLSACEGWRCALPSRVLDVTEVRFEDVNQYFRAVGSCLLLCGGMNVSVAVGWSCRHADLAVKDVARIHALPYEM